MTSNALPISRLVNVSVNLAPNAAQMQNISTLLILGTSTIIDITERYRAYSSIAAVAADFGTTAPEYLAASLYFQQTPQATQLLIGRWANTASAGVLKCATLPAASQAMSTWNAITTGSMKVTINATLATLTGLNFSAATTMYGVASIIQTALTVVVAGTTCVWNSAYSRFEITSSTTGATSLVSFLSATGSGTDISALMAGLSTSSGAYTTAGIAAESAVAAATLFDTNYGQAWYGLMILSASDSDHTSVAAYIEATTNKHTYWISTTAAGTLVSSSTTDIAYVMSQLNLSKSIVQWSSSNLYAAASLAAKALTIDYTANNSVIDLMYKQEPGITAETLNASQVSALETKNANVFLAYNNNTAIIEQGNNVSGTPIDVITGTDWLALDIQNAVYNLLYLSSTKVPQTDAGNHLILTTIEAELSRAVTNGLLAPGTWTAGGFGALKTNDFLAKGFYVYAPPIAAQSIADRSARKSVTFQIAAKLAGAIRTVNVLINVNR